MYLFTFVQHVALCISCAKHPFEILILNYCINLHVISLLWFAGDWKIAGNYNETKCKKSGEPTQPTVFSVSVSRGNKKQLCCCMLRVIPSTPIWFHPGQWKHHLYLTSERLLMCCGAKWVAASLITSIWLSIKQTKQKMWLNYSRFVVISVAS